MEVLVPVILGMKSKLTFCTKFSLECRGAQASISLERKSKLAKLRYFGTGNTCHKRSEEEKKNNEIRKKDGQIEWTKKRNTEWSNAREFA